jgi:hypothetical protein
MRQCEVRGAAHLPSLSPVAPAMLGVWKQCRTASLNDYVSQPVRSNDLLAVMGT